ncbi:alpha,alpha-trehalase TreA [Sphingopyxis sp. JAI128]|uniref:alpha,alpha-trehalase TreA n=1 Tax=Sphingopyxis sp. JAI128 TaxID=2723066 RepID=UPI00160F50D6|nr:alpha,alpha-trehalase TreA [Sphingopyxis sp. JAI128]MBB6425323.1 alpha,alpha-trehalase [Sphingopyxis sp. JAI128]
MSAVDTPAGLFGPLFAAVQKERVFPDSKTFADARPRRSPAAIVHDWQAQQPASGDGLRRFVLDNFDVPQERTAQQPDHLPLVARITALWPLLTRVSDDPAPGSSELWLPYSYVVPGGRFRELYYWDSYFTMLGLARSGRQDLVENMVGNFGSLLDRIGHIPNGTRSYYATRSHPPFFYLMARLSRDESVEGRRRRLGWMCKEYGFWMAGADNLAPGGEARRVVRLADGALLNRYWDDSDRPRDESWREDVALAAEASSRDAGELWRDIRAAAESGWDFSSRWLADSRTLATIRTTRMIPVDLNALLFGLEQAIAESARALGEMGLAGDFAARADFRARAIAHHLWNEDGGHYSDFDLDSGHASDQLTAAAAFPLFAGVASAERARATAAALERLLRLGGLMTTGCDSGQQWDAPNGWAPLQWIAIAGLRRYGEAGLADDIAERWLAMVEAHYDATGQLLEKYDVVTCAAGSGGEYATETGFGWTNGVTLELLAARGDTPDVDATLAGGIYG